MNKLNVTFKRIFNIEYNIKRKCLFTFFNVIKNITVMTYLNQSFLNNFFCQFKIC